MRWCGRWYRLDDSPADISAEEFSRLPMEERCRVGGRKPRYDGRMDGLRGYFYTYGDHHEASKTHVYLHSIEGDEHPGSTFVGNVQVWDTFRLEE